MKRIPAGILLLTLSLSAPCVLRADESAQQLADQTLGSDTNQQDESAGQLEKQTLGPDQKMQDQSAGQLERQDVGATQNLQDQSAGQLEQQDLGADQNMQDQSASNLAKQRDLAKKSKRTGDANQSVYAEGAGVDGAIYAIVSQSDGKVILGGRFNNVNGQPRLNLARINADGTLDTTFLAGPTDGVDGTVRALALDARGNLLVGGYFSTAQGQPRQNFVRYLASGNLDTSFAANLAPDGPVYAITVLPKGGVVIGGKFEQIGAQPRRNIAQFKADGTLAGSVAAMNASTGAVYALTSQPRGTFAGGKFEVSGQTARNLLLAP
jgi:uncharacterized delta-60 repeat protein